ncbi:MAG: hypothetical protein LC799_11960, partial [Actinobacteria bacterium]|nr:hypothetical protein [Actinomycetota bacterium]
MNQDHHQEIRQATVATGEGARGLPALRRRLLIALGVVGLLLATLGAPASAKNVDAQGLCERRNGSFIDLDGLAYVCLLPTAATKGEIRQAGRLCTERNGVLYVAVGNAAYACVLPGG